MKRRRNPSVPSSALVIGVGVSAALGFLWWANRRMGVPSLPATTQPAAASRIDRLLATPPSAAELAELATGPRIVFDAGAVDNEAKRRDIQAMLRAAMAIRFDIPIPVAGTTTMWDYIKRYVSAIRVVPGPTSPAADVATRAVLLPDNSLGGRPVWSDPDNGGAGVSQVVVLMHEARHNDQPTLSHLCDANGIVCPTDLDARQGTCPPGYQIGVDDPSLEYGGAWAVHYWTMMWLADHSGDWLALADRERIRARAQELAQYHFCDRRTGGAR